MSATAAIAPRVTASAVPAFFAWSSLRRMPFSTGHFCLLYAPLVDASPESASLMWTRE